MVGLPPTRIHYLTQFQVPEEGGGEGLCSQGLDLCYPLILSNYGSNWITFRSSGLFIFNTRFKQWFLNPGLGNIKNTVSLDHSTYNYDSAGGVGSGGKNI